MAAGEYLPPVVTRLTADIGNFVKGMANAKAVQDSFRSSVGDTNTALREQATLLGVLNPAITSMSRRLATASAWQAKLKGAIQDTNGALARQQAALGGVGLAAGVGAVAAAGGGGRGWWGIPLNATALHWIISGSSEILAVLVPAMIALGAAAAVAIEGVTNVGTHMESVYTATEATANMFGITAGKAIGLKGSLQSAQTAADPSIYGTLGSAIMTVNEHFGNLSQTGLQVIQTFQTFSARVVSDFAAGGAMGTAMDVFTSHMASDLTGIGQLFGNLGNGIMAAAAQMPGLAEILLKIIDNGTRLIAVVLDLGLKLQGLGFPILTVAMGLEEFNRWGSLAVTILTRLGIATAGANAWSTKSALTFARFDDVLRGLWSVIPNVIGGLGNLAEKAGAKGLGAAINDGADAIGMGISSLGTWQLALVTAGAVGLGFLIDKMLTARSAAQQLGDAMQKAVMSTANVNAPITIAANMAMLNAQLKIANKQVTQLEKPVPLTGGGGRFAGVNPNGRPVSTAVSDANAYNSALQQQQTDLRNVNQGAEWVAKTFGVSLPAALALADSANVKLAQGILGTGHSLSVQQLQIMSLMAGYRAMGQSSGEVGADMTALAVQSGLAGTQVSKLNSAWDEFMQNMTGGTTGLGSFVQSINNMGTVVASAKDNLGQAQNINLTTGQFANALTNFGQIGSQAWQNFGQVVGSTAPQLIDWFRIAGAEGAVSAGQMRNAVLGVVGSLTGFAAKSPTAQAQLLGLVQQVDPNIKTWGQLNTTIKNGKINLDGTAKAVEQATIKMGNMAQVAANLGNVLNQNLLSTLTQATITASGAGGAMQKYMQDIMNAGTSVSQTSADRKALIQDLEKLGYNASQAAQFIQAVQTQINNLHGKTITITTIMQAINGGGGAPGPLPPGSPGLKNGFAPALSAAHAMVAGGHGGSSFPGGGFAAFAPASSGEAVHEVNVFLDGRQIYRSTQKRATETQRRTGSNGLSIRTR